MIVLYILFAILSTMANLVFQYFSLSLYSGTFSLYIAMGIGTLAGLLLKYILDKKYIFFYNPKTKKDDGTTFFLYSIMGVFTTVIFWSFEIFFDHIFQTPQAKYIGAILGLLIGYIIKYFLDKKFVFKKVD